MPEPGVVGEGGHHHVGVRRLYQHPLLRALHTALLEEAEAEINRKLRVAVLMAAGHQQAEVARRLGVSPADVRATIQQLERVAPELGVAPPIDAD